MAQREPKQSQLDYLWTNFGEYSVSSSDGDKQLPTVGLVQELLEIIKDKSLNSLKVVGSKLIGYNINEKKLCEIDITELTQSGSSIIGFGKRYITEDDKGIQFSVGTPVYYIRLSDGSEFLTEIEGGIYTGAETNTIVVNISGSQIYADLKIDNENSIIELSKSNKGLRADLKIDKDSAIKLSKSDKGLKAETDSFYTKDQIDEKLADKGMEWNQLI